MRMVEAFPELIRMRGWWGWIEHWWCKTPDGTIVDPTRHQWPLDRDAVYKEFRDGVDPEPLGKCMNCGDYCWPYLDEEGEPVGKDVLGAIKQTHVGSCHCSKSCEEVLIRELSNDAC
jgi:hypothetical protein